MARTLSIKLPNTRDELAALFDKIQRRLTSYNLVSGVLQIKTSSSALAKTDAAIKYIIDGVYYNKAAADMAALSGTVVNATFNVFVFTVNAAGTLATRMGTAGATRAGVTFPTIPDGEIVIGFIEVNPTGTGDFVGGTTALDDATVVPNVVYVNTPFPFIPGLETL